VPVSPEDWLLFTAVGTSGGESRILVTFLSIWKQRRWLPKTGYFSQQLAPVPLSLEDWLLFLAVGTGGREGLHASWWIQPPPISWRYATHIATYPARIVRNRLPSGFCILNHKEWQSGGLVRCTRGCACSPSIFPPPPQPFNKFATNQRVLMNIYHPLDLSFWTPWNSVPPPRSVNVNVNNRALLKCDIVALYEYEDFPPILILIPTCDFHHIRNWWIISFQKYFAWTENRFALKIMRDTVA
jgi:hypothetical protein